MIPDSEASTPLLKTRKGLLKSLKTRKDLQDVDEQGSAIRHYASMRKHSLSLQTHLSEANGGDEMENLDHDNDVMMYHSSALTTWKAFHIGPQSVWRSSDLWSMMGKLGLVALAVALLTILLVPDPAALHVSKFTEVSKFLNVIIGLLMGFFLTSSTRRWHNCVQGFLQLLDAIRNLQMQFKALGVPKERSVLVSRYGCASAWLLYASLLTQYQRFTVAEGDLMAEAWDRFEEFRVDLDGNSVRLLENWEINMLRAMRDPPGIMWMWIANLIGKLSQDGLVPPMQTPTYGRIMNLCQRGHGGIRSVRTAVCVQAPLPYTHTLAVLVHFNNLLNAITFGMVFGCSLGTVLVRAGYHIHPARATGKETSQDMQMIGVTFLYCFFGPLMYQGLLLIGFHLAQPFDHEDTSVPLDVFLHRLEADLRDGNLMMARLPGIIPGFDLPSFKSPRKA